MKPGQYIKGGGEEKWNKWREQRTIERFSDNKDQVLGGFVDNLARKLNQPIAQKLDDPLRKQMQFTNQCPICLSMMLPPHRPMMMIPCGHNLCQRCLNTSTISNCPMCKTRIQTLSPNFSLMSLISQFKAAQVKQLRQEQKQSQGVVAKNDLELLQIRCNILQKEMNELKENYGKELRQAQLLDAVCKKLYEEKGRIRREREALEEEERLVGKYIQENQHKLKLARVTAENLQEKMIIMEKSLEPLLIEKTKQELFAAERLIKEGGS